MSAPKKCAIVTLGLVALGVCFADPASADPGFDPCRSSLIPICRLFPMMPDLDHDVDLTQNPDGLIAGHSPDNQPGTDQGG